MRGAAIEVRIRAGSPPHRFGDPDRQEDVVQIEAETEADAKDLLDLQREVTALYAQTQADDGYLDSVQQVRGKGERYTDLKWSHEMYCAGHLYQAAVAQHRATGGTGLLDVAIKNADHLVRTFGDGTAPDGTPKTRDVDGHPVLSPAPVTVTRWEPKERTY